jgi:hypothetical protein
MLTVKPALPKAWDWMEICFPIQDKWTRVHYRHDETKIEGSPIPWRIVKPR